MIAGPSAERATAALRDCRLCPRDCGVDRTLGPAGAFCRLGAQALVYKELLSLGEEAALGGPTWLVDVGGCSLRCLFCSEWQFVVRPHQQPARAIDAAWFAQRHAQRKVQGARTLSVVGGDPTPSAPGVLAALAQQADPLPLVWNCNGLVARQAWDLLDPAVAVWSIDVKFGNARCAERLAGARGFDMLGAVDGSVARALGGPRYPGLPRLIVRHLLMPGHLECCTRPVADRLAGLLAAVPVHHAVVNWMTAYVPPMDRRSRAPAAVGLSRWPDAGESARGIAIGRERLGPMLVVDGR
ncbi:MAG: hypothetical protein FJ100_13405 [Deltaproteobacteria bacterium]|nr:hypothetical protein [Deltaproteobacteria bacterium]